MISPGSKAVSNIAVTIWSLLTDSKKFSVPPYITASPPDLTPGARDSSGVRPRSDPFFPLKPLQMFLYDSGVGSRRRRL